MQRARQLVAPEGTGSLLSCVLSPHDGGSSLAVGGENASAVVFDLRGSNLVAHHLTAAVGCFGVGEAVPCVGHNPLAPHLLYCASGATVTAWDLRCLPAGTRNGGGYARSFPRDDAKDESFVFGTHETSNTRENNQGSSTGGSTHTTPLHVYAHNVDEINHFVIDSNGNNLYAADDSGCVAVVGIGDRSGGKNGVLKKTLKGAPSGHANICSSVSLRPHKPTEVVTGGLDACVCRWENHKSVPVTKWNITRLVGEHAEREAAAEAEAEGTDVASRVSPSQMMNPPFVHCVATWSCKSDPSVPHVRRIAAAACGDGTVALLDLDAGGSDKKSKKEKNSKKKANENFPPCAFLGRGELGTPHATATSHVCFPGWGDGEILVSGGNDRVIKIWRWGRAFGNGVLGPEPQPNQSECNPMEHSFLHGRKVNWVAHSDSRAAAPGGGHVFVCDTSEKITGYVVT